MRVFVLCLFSGFFVFAAPPPGLFGSSRPKCPQPYFCKDPIQFQKQLGAQPSLCHMKLSSRPDQKLKPGLLLYRFAMACGTFDRLVINPSKSFFLVFRCRGTDWMKQMAFFFNFSKCCFTFSSKFFLFLPSSSDFRTIYVS